MLEFIKNSLFVIAAIIIVAAIAGLAIGITIASGGFFFILFCVAILYGLIRETWENYLSKK